MCVCFYRREEETNLRVLAAIYYYVLDFFQDYSVTALYCTLYEAVCYVMKEHNTKY